MLELKIGDKEERVRIQNVFFAPGLCANLISVKQLMKEEKSVEFKEGSCYIVEENGETMEIATLREGMFELNVIKREDKALVVRDENVGLMWHRRLGHPAFQSMQFLKKYIGDLVIRDDKCTTCIRGKHPKQPFKTRGKVHDSKMNCHVNS